MANTLHYRHPTNGWTQITGLNIAGIGGGSVASADTNLYKAFGEDNAWDGYVEVTPLAYEFTVPV